jgi:hypothetical protein
MKSLLPFLLLAALSAGAQPNHFTWDYATNSSRSDAFIFSMGKQTPFNYSTNWIVFTNWFDLDGSLITGAMNYFAVQELESFTNTPQPLLSPFSNWVAVRRIPALAVWTVTSTNLAGTWTPLTTNAPVVIPMIAANQFLETAFAKTNIFEDINTNSFGL